MRKNPKIQPTEKRGLEQDLWRLLGAASRSEAPPDFSRRTRRRVQDLNASLDGQERHGASSFLAWLIGSPGGIAITATAIITVFAAVMINLTSDRAIVPVQTVADDNPAETSGTVRTTGELPERNHAPSRDELIEAELARVDPADLEVILELDQLMAARDSELWTELQL